MNNKEFKDLVKQRDEMITLLNSRFEGTIQEAQGGLLKQFMSKFVDLLQVDENGNIAPTAYNKNMLLTIDKLFTDYGKQHNVAVLATLLNSVGSVLDFNAKYYSNFTKPAELLPLKKKAISNVQGWLGIDDKTANENGYLSTLVKSDAVKNQLKDLSMRAVYSQKGWQKTKQEIKDFIDGKDGKSLGALEKYYRNYSYDLISQVDRATAKTYADDLKFEFAIYEGGLIETSRPFCEEHNGKVYHISEILKFDPPTAKQPNYNPITDLGGYACRHHLNWIPTSLALMMRPDAKNLVGTGITGVKTTQEPKKETPKEQPKAVESKKLTQDNLNAVEEYISGDGMWVNNWLRKKPFELNQEEKDYLKNLDAATSNPLNYNGNLYRSVDASSIFPNITDSQYDSLKAVLVYGSNQKWDKNIADSIVSSVKQGSVFVEKGFMSTTKDEKVAVEWGGFSGSSKPIILKIKTNENTKGFDTGNHKMAQEEIILQRGQEYEVEKIYEKNGEIYVDVKLKNASSKVDEVKEIKKTNDFNPNTKFEDIEPLEIIPFTPSKEFESGIKNVAKMQSDFEYLQANRKSIHVERNNLVDKINALIKKKMHKTDEYNKLYKEYEVKHAELKEAKQKELAKQKEIYKDGEKEFQKLLDNLKYESTVQMTGLMTKKNIEVFDIFKKISARYNDGETIKFNKVSERAYFSPSTKSVNLAASDDKYVIFHELAHSLELNNHVFKAAVDFFNKRTAGKTAKSLSEINKAYKYDEFYKEGGFYDPYVGKIYKGNSKRDYEGLSATEIISMGLEQMMKNPRLFYYQDKEHFELIYNLFFRQ